MGDRGRRKNCGRRRLRFHICSVIQYCNITWVKIIQNRILHWILIRNIIAGQGLLVPSLTRKFLQRKRGWMVAVRRRRVRRGEFEVFCKYYKSIMWETRSTSCQKSFIPHMCPKYAPKISQRLFSEGFKGFKMEFKVNNQSLALWKRTDLKEVVLICRYPLCLPKWL